MTETQYRRSNGEWVDIAGLPYPHLKSAAEKLRREGGQPAALETMDARLVVLEGNFRAEQEAALRDPNATAEQKLKATQALAKLDAGR